MFEDEGVAVVVEGWDCFEGHKDVPDDDEGDEKDL